MEFYVKMAVISLKVYHDLTEMEQLVPFHYFSRKNSQNFRFRQK